MFVTVILHSTETGSRNAGSTFTCWMGMGFLQVVHVEGDSPVSGVDES